MKNFLKSYILYLFVLFNLIMLLFILYISSNTFASFIYEKNINNLNNTDLESYSYSINNTTDVATPYIKDMTMIQDDNNFYIDYDIVFENQDLTFDLNNTLISDEIDEEYGVNNKVESFGGNIILTEEKDKDFSLNTKTKRENNTYTYTGSASSNNENTDYNIVYTKDSSGSNMLTYDVKLPMTKSILGINFKSDIKDVYKNQFLNDFPNRIYGKMFYKATASITCNTTMLDNSHFRYKYKGTITIPKQNKDKYKYLQLISPKALKTSIVYNRTTNGVNLVETYKGIKSISIDISNMYVCGANYKENVFYSGNSDHNWTYTNNANTTTHEKYCSKCKWMARENHNLEYEYDGFTHNACKCGYIQKVNVSYLIDGAFQYKKIYNSFSNIEKPVLDIPAGKAISHYAKTELQYLNEDNIDFSETNTPLKEVNIGNVNLINDKTGLYSTIYNAITKVKITTDNDNGGLSGGSGGGGNIRIFGLPDLEVASPSEPEPIVLTENYKVSKADEIYKTLNTSSTNTARTQEYSLGTLTIKDSEQNPATLSDIKKFKMRQDNEYYYFDFDLIYENRNIEIADPTKVGDCTLYISNTINDTLNYEYTTYAYGGSYANSVGGTYSSGFYTYGNHNETPAVQYQSLFIENTKKQGTQTMTNVLTKGYSSGYSCVYTPTENIIENHDEYSSLVYPFEKYLGREKAGIQTYIYSNTYDVVIPDNISMPNLFSGTIMSYLLGQILWTNNQSNKIMPIKPNYNMVNITNQIYDSNKHYWNKELIGTISIKKNDINNYKYINMYAPEGYIVNKTFNSFQDGNSYSQQHPYTVNGQNTMSSKKANINTSPAKSESAMSIHSTFGGNLLNINLTELSHCDHEWHLTYCDDIKHIMKCSKCEWEKDENHNYQYEYDGMTNNVCECSKVLHVKNHYLYNSDLKVDEVDIHDPNVEISSKSNPTKTGYIFNDYSIYHKIPKIYSVTNTIINEKYIKNSNETPTKTATYSSVIKANYNPIKYKFKFSKENNLNLISTYSDLPVQEFNYDEEKAISDCINIDNYFFKGWSLATNSEIIITPKQLVKNYTTINNQEIILYPNYEPVRFTINYTTDKSNFSNGTLQLTKNYDLTQNDSLYLDLPILSTQVYEEKSGKYSVDVYTTNFKFNYYEDEFSNKYYDINDVINYIKQNALTNNLILSLKANISQNTTKGYRDSGGGTGGADPTGTLYKKDIQNIEDLTKYELYNNLDMFIEPQYVPYVKKAIEKDPNMLDVIEKDIKIYGFTLTLDDMKEKLTKEEIVEVEESLKNTHYIVVSSMTKQERFNMFIKDHKVLFIILSIVLILILAGSILWYFDKLPFLRRNR